MNLIEAKFVINLAEDSLKSVSYTHLDVYKRQGIPFVVVVSVILVMLVLQHLSVWRKFHFWLSKKTVPVNNSLAIRFSDVYKRQSGLSV